MPSLLTEADHTKQLSGLITTFKMKIRTLFTIFTTSAIIFAQSPLTSMITMGLQHRDNDQDEDGHWIRDHYHYKTESIERLEVNFNYGLGELKLNANPRGKMINGSLRYYSDQTIPRVEYHTFGLKGILDVDIKTHDRDGITFSWSELKSIRGHAEHLDNELDFYLPINVDIDLQIDFGLGEAHINLTDLDLINVNLDCGLSDVHIQVAKPNKTICRSLRISSGLGSFIATGLGNLQVREIDIEVGLGSAEIDLRGYFENDIEVDIEVGLGSLELILPGDVNIRAKVHDTFLSSVDVDDLLKKGGTWVSPEWERSRPTLTLDVSVGLGSVDIDLRP